MTTQANDSVLMSPVRFRMLDDGDVELCPVSAIRTLGLYLDDQVGTPAKMLQWVRELAGDDDADVEVRMKLTSTENIIALRIGSEAWRVIGFEFVDDQVPVCRKCGCTDDLGCSNRCSWVQTDLCSACA